MNNCPYSKVSSGRRQFLTGAGTVIIASALPSFGTATEPGNLISHAIPKTGELLPAIGMGTWITFNVGRNVVLQQQRTEVLDAFFEAGGKLVDSSPMYGASEHVLGEGLKTTGTSQLFSATKTWTSSEYEGPKQFAESKALWGVGKFDLLQIHNLLAWQKHLPYLRELKEQGDIRYLGITTSHGRRGEEIKRILKTQDIDFLQLTYNLQDRGTERELIPMARDKGVAIICNRPFQGGRLPRLTQDKPVPPWASEIGCQTWPQLLLKYVISTPGVTAAIPATSKVTHMRENMMAMQGELPGVKLRRDILSAFQALS